MRQQKSVLRLVESAVLLAVATVLSMIKLLDLPYGGSVTAAGTLPVLLIAYRHGVRFGVFAGAVYGMLQLLLGANALSYCPTALAAVAVIVLDYLLAFAAMGAAGAFRNRFSQGKALVMGAMVTGILRYICHVISGCTVWAGLSIPTDDALLYSLAYNATYMLPETVVTALAAWYLSAAVDLRGERPARVAASASRPRLWRRLLRVFFFGAAVTTLLLIFRHGQDAETGAFSSQWLADVP